MGLPRLVLQDLASVFFIWVFVSFPQWALGASVLSILLWKNNNMNKIYEIFLNNFFGIKLFETHLNNNEKNLY